MRSWCQIDQDRELANPPDKPFKATPLTYINRAYRRLFATEEDRAREELIEKTRRETATLERESETWRQQIAALEKRVSQLEQAKAAPSGWFSGWR
jgi:multidrug efflux pump subunit AcrA (membrane-fusion protein)